MNSVNLIGRLTRDPEVRYTTTEKIYAQFTLAVDKPIVDQNGQRQADFINVMAWNKTAELVSMYVKKGNKIGITGRINTRSYDNQNGQKVYVTEVIAERIDFCNENKNQNTNKTEEREEEFKVEVEEIDWDNFNI